MIYRESWATDRIPQPIPIYMAGGWTPSPGRPTAHGGGLQPRACGVPLRAAVAAAVFGWRRGLKPGEIQDEFQDDQQNNVVFILVFCIEGCSLGSMEFSTYWMQKWGRLLAGLEFATSLRTLTDFDRAWEQGISAMWSEAVRWCYHFWEGQWI